MANALQICGIKNSFPMTSRRRSLWQRLLSQRIHFVESVVSVDPLCCTSRVTRGRVAFSVSCKARSIDLIDENETGNGNFDETENPFTCVMKFGGSLVATAERMRADIKDHPSLAAMMFQGFPAAQQAFEPTVMGIIRSCFSFITSAVCGVYLAQNYQVPNIMKLANTAMIMAKHIEEKYRKHKKGGGDNDNFD